MQAVSRWKQVSVRAESLPTLSALCGFTTKSWLGLRTLTAFSASLACAGRAVDSNLAGQVRVAPAGGIESGTKKAYSVGFLLALENHFAPPSAPHFYEQSFPNISYLIKFFKNFSKAGPYTSLPTLKYSLCPRIFAITPCQILCQSVAP